ncbi:pollen receptor-like kinase 3 [Andrographis paniculata]|uniref:pollen receptor-like kinase 3 n=1 Tax=Andrographis paniculata TaxID=175694 RepID=UPI0021E892C1|nr:pollen receptor-like kinase 3 [Andrographis paniculata]XP_051147814.1 pollen receptor-like kinase 3 [Andrographis paniculata]
MDGSLSQQSSQALSSPESDALLKLKASFTNAAALDSWQPGTEPCEVNRLWAGVKCENGVVSGLRLGNMGLSGRIDADALAPLPGLRSIAITGNLFSGQIPDFHRVGALKGLYISDNQFSGAIPPDYFSKMAGLKKVWLSGNQFSGQIPPSLSQLSQLMELHLENNQFSGQIPPLEQVTLSSFNVSNNKLEGEIPSSMKRFGSDSFGGNPGLCGGASGKPCNQPAAAPAKSNGNGFGIALWCLLGVAVLLLLILLVVFAAKKRNKTTNAPVMENLNRPVGVAPAVVNVGKKDTDASSRKATKMSGNGSSRRRDIIIINDDKGEFGLADLMKAAAEVLGNGAFGSSYKAVMTSGLAVVVKRVKEMAKMGRDQFDAEMRRLGRLRHKNVLTPLAYHYRKEEKLLVSEYQPNGSLLFVLHGDRGASHSELNWSVRLKIVQGIARGLGYLHAQLSTFDLPHGDLKSSNVLLASDYEPLLSDYGLHHLMGNSQAAQALAAYKAPEAQLHQQISPKCDVYCLGIIILEILTGKFPSQYSSNSQGGTDLVQWARSAIAEGREADLLDPDIAQTTNSIGAAVQLLRVGAACTESSLDHRLDLDEAIRRIEGIAVDGAETIQVVPPSPVSFSPRP